MPQGIVVITGCSEGGIGDALAREFHRRGLRVIATARSPGKMRRLLEDTGCEALELDVADPASVRRAAADLARMTGGRLDLLVNNSGLGYQMPLADADLDEARRLYDVNVWGTLAVIQAFLPLLLASAAAAAPASSSSSSSSPGAGGSSSSSSRPPRILNIGSVTSRMSVPWQGIYNSSKAALHMLNDTLRVELAPLGVQVLHVVTGGVQTRFYANALSGGDGGNGANGDGDKKADLLPSSSPYAPVRAAMEADLAGRGGKSHQSVTADDYARAVAANALRRRPTKTLWIGGTAALSWMGDRFLWSTTRDWVISTFMFPMNHLKREVQKHRAGTQ